MLKHSLSRGVFLVCLVACGDDTGDHSPADAAADRDAADVARDAGNDADSGQASDAGSDAGGDADSGQSDAGGDADSGQSDAGGDAGSGQSDAGQDAATGPSGYSVALDGVDGYIVLGERAEIFSELPTAMSVSVWLKMSDALPGSGDGIFTVDGGSGFGTGFDVFWSTALEEPAVAFYPPGDGSVVRATPAERTAWTHVVAVYDPDAGAGQEASLYLDGELAAMGAAAGVAPLLPDGELWIGKYDNDGLLSEGSFDEVAIWSSALAADEVAALYNAGSPADALTDGGAYASSGSLAGYWRMGDDDDGAGTSVKDLTGNSAATLVGGASFSSDAP